MKKIGIVVCNYNKSAYVVNCVRSLQTQSIKDFDIYVVDNASSDDSVQALRENFGTSITILENQENLGGSGGFNTGIRRALQENYEYIMLLDNDVVLDENAVKELYNFLETHEDVGMVGSKVYYMDEPDLIWGYGGCIDFDRYTYGDKFKNRVDSNDIPEISYSDFVAACSVMARTSAIKKAGIMPEENFIYWDDMEWGYCFNQAGYKVAIYGRSKAWHKGGGGNDLSTFSKYYMWRNRIRFFLKYLNKEALPRFADAILSEMFQMIYSCRLKREDNIIRSVMYAFDDAVHGIAGKAEEYKILPRRRNTYRVADALGSSKSVLVKFNGDFEGLGNIVRCIKKNRPDIQVGIYAEATDRKAVSYQYKESCKIEATYVPKKYDSHMIMCEHIFKLAPDAPCDTYIDSWCNIIYSEEDFIYAKSFEQTRQLFVMCRKDLITYGK